MERHPSMKDHIVVSSRYNKNFIEYIHVKRNVNIVDKMADS